MSDKKVNLTPTKKTVLLSALRQQAGRMDQYMRRLYDETATHVESSSRLGRGDRCYLNEVQAEAAVFALRRYEPAPGDKQSDIHDIICQLTMTRAEFSQYMSSNAGVMEVPL